MGRHLNAEQVRRFLADQGPRCSRTEALHLVQCPECRDLVIGESRSQAGAGPLLARVLQHPARWQGGDARAREAKLIERLSQATEEVAQAPALLAELLGRHLDKWTLLFDNSSRFHSLALAREILYAGHREARDRPVAGAAMARAALVLIDRLDASRYGDRLLDDLRARGWAIVGDCRRIAGDLKGADAAFRRARRLIRDTADSEELANYHYLRGVLAKDQRRTERALRHFGKARKLSEEIDDREKLARILTSSAVLSVECGEPEEALPLLLEASLLVDDLHDDRLALFVRSNLALCLTDLGEYTGAQEIFQQCRRHYNDSYLLLRGRWLEGRIAAGLGDTERGESLLVGARAEYLERGQHYNAALVSLHLAALYARQGRSAELKVLAEEMAAVFVAQDVPAEAIAALAFFRQAVEQERATEELVGGVARFLQRARTEPGIRFQRR